MISHLTISFAGPHPLFARLQLLPLPSVYSKFASHEWVDGRLSLTLEPTARTHDGHTLIHDDFSNGQVTHNPRFSRLVVGDFVFADTGAGL